MSYLSRASGRVRRVRSLICPTLVSGDLRSSLLRYSSSSEDVKKDVKKIYLGDTLAFVRRLEAQGMPTNLAEVTTANMTEIVNHGLEHVISSFAAKSKMDKFEVVQGSTLTQFISEMKNIQEKNFTSLQREIEKVKEEIDKMDLKFTSKLHQEITTAKFEIIKYSVGTFISVATISLALVRIWM